MASLLQGFLGQQDSPSYQQPYLGDLFSAIRRGVTQLAPETVRWNELLAPGIAGAQRAGEDVYDPNRGAIRDKVGSLIRGQLDNPYALPPQIMALLRQQGFEGAAGSGLNTSDAGRAGVASLLGTKALEYGENVINRGVGYGTNTANLWQPQSLGLSPADVGSAAVSFMNQGNAQNQYQAELDAMNSRNLLSTPLNLGGSFIGSILAAAFGTQGMGEGLSSLFQGAGGPSADTLAFARPSGVYAGA